MSIRPYIKEKVETKTLKNATSMKLWSEEDQDI